jgi:hypothetical protein
MKGQAGIKDESRKEANEVLKNKILKRMPTHPQINP